MERLHNGQFLKAWRTELASCLFCVLGIVLFGLVHFIGFVLLFKVSIVIGPCPNLLPFFLSLVPYCTTNLLYAPVYICTIHFLFHWPLWPLHFLSTQRSPLSFLDGALGHLLISLCYVYFLSMFLDPSLYLFPFINVSVGLRSLNGALPCWSLFHFFLLSSLRWFACCSAFFEGIEYICCNS